MKALIALGSNLGDPLEQLRTALKSLSGLGDLEARSSLFETLPVGGPAGQDRYLNAVVVLEPYAPYQLPHALMNALLNIERARGRVREVRWAARTLDLDLLALDDWQLESFDLTLPHPRMMTRPFVLAPLCEAAPHWRHPVTGQSACEALAGLDQSGVKRSTLSWD